MAAVTYLVATLITMWFENTIIYPAPKFPAGEWEAQRFRCEDVYFSSADGTQLHGWYFPHPQARGNLLFCHGNGEHVGYLGYEMAELRDEHKLSIFVFDYRGYGRSSGSPNEPGVLADAEAAHAWLAQRAGIQPHDIILMGRSIGGAVTVHLASKYGARGLILWNTFSSMTEVAAQHFPWLPVRWLIRNRYNSVEKISKYSGPMLITHGTGDRTIAFDLAEKLFRAAPSSDKKFVRVVDGDHNDQPSPEFMEECSQFIDRICHPASEGSAS